MEQNKTRQEKNKKGKENSEEREEETDKEKEIALTFLSSPLLHFSEKRLLATVFAWLAFGSERIKKLVTQRKMNMKRTDFLR